MQAQDHSSIRRTPGGSTSLPAPQPLAGWPLLHLPKTAQQAVVAHLPQRDQGSLRLACRSTTTLVDECAKWLRFEARMLHAAPQGLAGRFPAVTTLRLIDGFDCSADAAQLMQQSLVRVMQGSPWRSVTTLDMQFLAPEAAMLVVAGCPNTQHLHMQAHLGGRRLARQRLLSSACDIAMQELLHTACSTLPLRSLKIGSMRPLEDGDLKVIAGCNSLVSLTVSLGKLSASGWAALLSMRGLTSLHASRSLSWSTHVPAGVVLDFNSSMPQLQELRLGLSPSDSRYQAATASDMAPYAALRLPSSLTSLQLQRLPQPALQLPALLDLELSECTVKDQDLARLAAGCRALGNLQLDKLQLTAASSAAPLAALTSLVVDDTCSIGDGVRLAAVFPALKKLQLNCRCEVQDAGVLFGGASALEELDVGRHWDVDSKYSGLRMHQRALVELGRLPALRTMRLNAYPAHVAGFVMLDQLHKVEWVLDQSVSESYDELRGRFATASAPVSLTHACFCFRGGEEEEEEEEEAELQAPVHPFARVADSVISWCVRAPALHTVEWDIMPLVSECAAMTDLRLSGLAASASIRTVILDPSDYDGQLAQMVRVLGQNRGLHVQYC